jgi:hypothetical protein
VEPKVPVPVGVGIFIAGGNANEIRGNRIYDNWRRGTMLNVPDSLSDEGRTTVNSVSHRNRYHNNVMGIAPDGSRMPNGVDFWWDEAPNQMDNCWFDNGQVTTDPPGPLMPVRLSQHERRRDLPGQAQRRATAMRGLDRGQHVRLHDLPVVQDA